MRPDDPYLDRQWHLTLLGDIQTVWNDYTGAGVHVAVVDSGVDFTNPDLAARQDASRDPVIDGQVRSGAPGGTYAPPDGTSHGTAVAGLIAASGNNGVGVVGVSFGASITSFDIFDDTLPEFINSADHSRFLQLLHQQDRLDVSNNSWGAKADFTADRSLTASTSFAAQTNAVYADLSANGRHGLGTVLVQSAGNDAIDADGDGVNVSRYTITVAAVQQSGYAASYSDYGASILVAAPGSDTPGSIVTTDRSGAAGYNAGGASDGFDGTGDYASDFNGTSASAPIVSGVVALMLQANPNLGWRDVQTILALSATATGTALNDPAKATTEHDTWHSGGGSDWNGGGRHFNESYGYGEVNAFNAVRLAEAWHYLSPIPATSADELSVTTGTLSPAQTAAGDRVLTYTFTLADLDIEHVDLTLGITAANLKNTYFDLTAPDGRVYKVSHMAADDAALAANGLTWTYGFDGFRGESAAGIWTLRLLNFADTSLTLDTASLTAYGTSAAAPKVFHYTEEFHTVATLGGISDGRTALVDQTGTADWIDAAPLHGASTVDLKAGTAVIDGVAVTVTGTGVRNVIGGDGDDRFTASDFGGTLVGARGADTLVGGLGNDVLTGGAGQDRLSGGDGPDRFQDSAAGLDGDTITDLDDFDLIDVTDATAPLENLSYAGGVLSFSFAGLSATTYTVNLLGAAFGTGLSQRADASGTGVDIYFDAGGNHRPVGTADSYATNEDAALTVAAAGVLANDRDPDGNALTAVLATGPAHGALTLSPDGGFVYRPAADYNGSDSFTYRANDGTASGNEVLVSLTVRAVDDAPVAFAESYTVDEDEVLSPAKAAGVLANDRDVDGRPMKAVLNTGPSNGSLSLNADGSFYYRPNYNFNGQDSFTYHANDGRLDSGVVTVALTVNPVNDAPLANDDSYTAQQTATLTVPAGTGVLANDFDPEGDPKTASLVAGPRHGALDLRPDGSFSYTPTAGYKGPDSFTYRASDGTLSGNVATVSIDVPDRAPRPTADGYTVDQGATLTVGAAAGVLANDTDPDGDHLTAVLSDSPRHGSLTLNADGSFTYTPDANYHGQDSFRYYATDSDLYSGSTLVTLTVNATSASLPPGSRDAPGVVRVVSTDDAGAPGNRSSSDPVVSPDGRSVVFDSKASLLGPGGDTNNTYDVYLKDLSGAIVRLSTATDGTQAAGDSYLPVVSPDGKKVAFVSDASNLVANDSGGLDVFVRDLATGQVTIVSAGPDGVPVGGYSPAFSADGRSVAFVTSSALAPDDTNGSSDIYLKTLATGAVTRLSTDDAGHEIRSSSIAPALSPDGSKLAFVSYQALAPGADEGTRQIYVKDLATGHVTLASRAADGPDGQLGAAGNSYAGSDGAVFSPDGTKLAFWSNADNLVPGDTNRGLDLFVKNLLTGEILIVTKGEDGSQGDNSGRDLPAFSPDGRKILFSSEGSYLVPGDTNGFTDSFVRDLDTGMVTRVSTTTDGKELMFGGRQPGWSPDGKSVVFVSPDSDGQFYQVLIKTLQPSTPGSGDPPGAGNTPPVSQDDAYTTSAGQALSVTGAGILINDSDADGQALSAVLVAGPGHGTLSLDPAGSFTYAPEFGFSGLDTFTYRASDGQAPGNVATVTIEVTGTDPAVVGVSIDAIAGDDAVDATEKPLALTISGGVRGVENGQIVAVALTDATGTAIYASGTAAVSNGAWSLTLPAGTASALPDGSYRVVADVADRAGTGAEATRPFTVDTTPGPKIAITSIAGDDVVNSAEAAAPVTVAGTSEAIGRTVTVSCGGEARGTALVQSDGTWSAPVDLHDARGETTLTATVSDAAGHGSTATGFAFVDANTVLSSPPGTFTGVAHPSLSGDAGLLAVEVSGDFAPYGAFEGQIVVEDLRTGAVTLISKGIDGRPTPEYVNQKPMLSADGRFVVFQSTAVNLVADDTNGSADVFEADLATGVIRRVSTTGTGAEITGGAELNGRQSVSADGRYVVFTAKLDSAPSDSYRQVYRKDMLTGELRLASAGGQSDGDQGSISADGRFVAFSGGGVTPGHGFSDVFVRDLDTGALTLASPNLTGSPTENYDAGVPVISGDGTHVLFASFDYDAYTVDHGTARRFYVYDLANGTATLVSPAQAPTFLSEANSSLSADGRTAAFPFLTLIQRENGTAIGLDVYVRDLATGTLTLVSSDNNLLKTVDDVNYDGYLPNLSTDGSVVAFVQQTIELDYSARSDIVLRRLHADGNGLTLAPIAGDDDLSPAEAASFGSTLPLHGTTTAPAGSVVSIFVDRTEITTATVGSDGTWATTINALGLSPTEHSVRATVQVGAFTLSDGALLQIEPGARDGTPTFYSDPSLFGTVIHDASGPAGQIYELYEGLLGRAPDATGYEFWLDGYAHGATLRDIAADILGSGEYTGLHGPAAGELNAGFVDEMYQVVLGRTPDADGRSFWIDALEQGASRAEVAYDFATGPENRAQDAAALSAGVFVPDPVASDVARLYYATLDRAPDAGGLQFWTEAVKGGVSEAAMAQLFLDSAEYHARFGTPANADFVYEVYDGALGRAPTPAEATAGQLDLAAHSRAEVALGIADSPEANVHHLADIEQGWHLVA